MVTKAGKFAKLGAIIGVTYGTVSPVVRMTINKSGREAAMSEARKRGMSNGTFYGIWSGLVVVNALVMAGIGAGIGAITGLFFKKEDKKAQLSAPQEQGGSTTGPSTEQHASDVPEHPQKPKASFQDQEATRGAPKDTALKKETSPGQPHKSESSFQDKEGTRAASKDTAEQGASL